MLSHWDAELDASLEREIMDYDAFEFLSRSSQSDTLNLMQGDFKPENPVSNRHMSWWKVATIAAVAFLLHISFVVGQGVFLNIEGDRDKSEARALYKDVFPSDRNVNDMTRRWRAHLSGAGNDTYEGGFLKIFGTSAKALSSDLHLDNINYSKKRGDLILQLQASDRDKLVSYAQKLSDSGLNASIGTINQEADHVSGNVKIRAEGGS